MTSSDPHHHVLYSPLPSVSTHIRLATLLPAQKFDDTIKCSTSVYDLKSCVRIYEALSYACGDPDATAPIILNGRTVEVYQNLEFALRSLRRKRTCRILWVDAICIDQTLSEEKSAQVLLLSQIYRQAKLTLAWLGTDRDVRNSGVSVALNMMLHLAKHSTKRRILRLERLVPAIRGVSVSRIDAARIRWEAALMRKSVLPQTPLYPQPWAPDLKLLLEYVDSRPSTLGIVLGDKGLRLIYWFLCQTYFSRLWIYQELVLASELVFVCNSELFDGWQVISAIEMLMSRAILDLTAIESSPSEGGWGTFLHMQILTTLLRSSYKKAHKNMPVEALPGAEKPSLLFLVISFLAAKCMDPRDHVFALLGLTDDPLIEANRPDYTLDEQHVFKRLTVTYITATGNLDILSFCGWSSSPTWTLNMNISHSNSPVYASLFTPGRRLYRTAGDTTQKPNFHPRSSSDSTLRLSGYCIDRIKESRPPVRPSASFKEDLRGRLQLFHAATTLSEDEFWMMCANGYLMRAGFDLEQLVLLRPLLHRWLATDWDVGYVPDFVVPFWSGLVKAFFVTARGRMGLCRGQSQPGDLICVLFGGQTPFILRENMHVRQELLEDCYVHGVMEGESMAEFKAGQYAEESFVLI